MGFAAVTAYPLFRMKGFYFFIGSFAIGEAVRLSWIRWNNPFGGWDGIMNIQRPVIGSFVFSSTFSYYWLTLGIAVACLLTMYQIERSRLGDTLKSIHTNDSLAESGDKPPEIQDYCVHDSSFLCGNSRRTASALPGYRKSGAVWVD